TFYPANTRATATEITLHAGEELGGVDMSFRGAKSHGVTGSLTGSIPSTSIMAGAIVVLTDASSGAPQSMTFSLGAETPRSFGMHGIPDGQYFIMAVGGIGADEMTASPPRRITVAGSDVTGLELRLGPLSQIAGHVVLERLSEADRKPRCPAAAGPRPI